MTIYFVRHAESNSNINPHFDVPRDGLTAIGKAQAALLGKRFKNVGIDGIYTSETIRARQTGQYIAERIGLASQIASPFILHINPDDSDMIAKADAQGSTPFQYQSDVPGYPCHSDFGPNVIQFWASLDGFGQSANTVIGQWMLNNGWIDVSTHSFSWMGAAGVETETFSCHQVNEKPLRFLLGPPVVSGDSHHGINLIALKRSCTNWTYANVYEMEIPGKGNVKVFAGTFNYRLLPLLPGLTTTGSGTAEVKMFADPDTGTWRLMEFQRSNDNTSITWTPIPPGTERMQQPLEGHCPGP